MWGDTCVRQGRSIPKGKEKTKKTTFENYVIDSGKVAVTASA